MPSAKNKVQPQNISHEHELDSKGVYQLANGAWAYRFCKSVNGKNVYKRASTDRKGNPLLTQRDAMLAREEAMNTSREPMLRQLICLGATVDCASMSAMV